MLSIFKVLLLLDAIALLIILLMELVLKDAIAFPNSRFPIPDSRFPTP
ncbi:MAG: hypothetical protein F6K55_41915 [Moorea sp. SIO4A3]|nr:hypothetical protein [Moorena sp. SIO4A3]